MLQGWKRFGVTQFQSTATKVFPGLPAAGISSITVVGEAAVVWANGLPRNKGILGSSYATDTVSVENNAAPNAAFDAAKGKATTMSGGYVAALVVEMPDTLPYGVITRPSVSLRHDAAGRSPGGAGTFEEGNAAASFGVTFSYINKWTGGVQFTHNFSLYNTQRFNGALDRDFLSGVVAYRF